MTDAHESGSTVPKPSRIPHSSAAFLHHLHTGPTSHHIALGSTPSRQGSPPPRSPHSAAAPLDPFDFVESDPPDDTDRVPSAPATPNLSIPESLAGPSSLRGLGRRQSRTGRPSTAPTRKTEMPGPLRYGSSSKLGSIAQVDNPSPTIEADPAEEELVQLTCTTDDCLVAVARDEVGFEQAMEVVSRSGGSSGTVLLGKAGNLFSPISSPGPSSTPFAPASEEPLSWDSFSKSYAHGMFDPNKIPDPPVLTSSPPSTRLSLGQHRRSSPAQRHSHLATATSSADSRGSSSTASGSSGATISTQASSAPPTSAEDNSPGIMQRSNTMAMSLATRDKAFELENLPRRGADLMRPNNIALPSYSLAAATVRMASSLRISDFAPLDMPSPERELLDPMASVVSTDTAGGKEAPNSDPGSRTLISRSMSSTVGTSNMHKLPMIQHSPVSSPGESARTTDAKGAPGLGRRKTSPQRSGGGIVNSRIPPASAPLERKVDSEPTSDYFGSASPHLVHRPSYSSQTSSSRTATAGGTPMMPKPTSPAASERPFPSPNPSSDPQTQLAPAVARAQDIGPLYDKLGWLPAPLPPDELARRKALYRFNILHTARDANFDRIAHMAKLVFNPKIVLIALIDSDTQWHKAQSGLGADQAERISSFCSHSVLSRSDEPFVVLNARQDWRFCNNPQVLGPPHIRFYAGAPIRTADGHNVGSLCIIDDKPWTDFSPRSRLILKEFAAVAMREMELWRDKLQLRVRDKIQTSMENFTRECLEMDDRSSSSNVEGASKMDKVYSRAAQLVCSTLDLDGCFILDIGHFEMMSFETSAGSKTVYRADPYVSEQQSPILERSDSFGPVSPLVIFAMTPSTAPTRPISADEHEKISDFLRENRDGRIFENFAPSWLRYMFPAKFRYGMVVPVFGVDQQPFALICAYTSNKAKQYLEGYELQFLRAIGVIILSAVLRRRMVLADKTKSVLISSVSHELRTPLHGILAAAELLGETELDANQISFLKTVQTCGNSLIETVNHVLDFTKLSGSTSGGGSAVRLAPANLAQLVEQTVEGCWIGQRARLFDGDADIGSFYAPPASAGLLPKNRRDAVGEKLSYVETVIDIAQREKGWNVRCEKGGLRRVLMNLVGNSLKFTTDGYVQITLRELPHAQDSKRIPVEMAVIDTGKGIGKGFLKDQLFQPFSQENPLQTGTGLGLAIVNSIVRSEGINGKVDVWSSEGLGTEIRISFEVEVVDEDDDLSSSSSVASTTSIGRGHSLSLLAFNNERRGHMLSLEVLGAYAAAWHFELKDDGDILVINDDDAALRQAQSTPKPIIFLLSQRTAQANAIRESVNRAGGFCQILYKPIGPSLFRRALQCAANWLEDQADEPARPNIWRGESTESRESQESNSTISDLSHVRFEKTSLERMPLMRRRSEEEQQQSTQRPPMAPRGVTYHTPHRVVSSERSASFGSPQPSSPGSTVSSTISLAGGGVMLKTAAVVLGESSRRERTPRVMVVEDNVINRRVLGAFLKKKGFEYFEAVDGQAGVDLFEATPPQFWDVILMDISMPVMNGHEATRGIRKLEANRRMAFSSPDTGAVMTQSPGLPTRSPSIKVGQPRAKIFALTGLATLDDKREAFSSGVDGYLVKPVSMASLDIIFKRIGF